jgi:hypothetical protein
MDAISSASAGKQLRESRAHKDRTLATVCDMEFTERLERKGAHDVRIEHEERRVVFGEDITGESEGPGWKQRTRTVECKVQYARSY